MKWLFFPNKRKNLRPFCSDVPIRFHALRTLGAGAAIENHENNENIGTDIKQATLNGSWM